MLRTEITILTVLTSAAVVLLAGAANLYVFFSFFYEKTREDIQYVLINTGQQFQDKMQFIEDGAVSIRHNVMLEDYFGSRDYDRTAAETGLAYSMQLFSDRNAVNRQYPFATGVYLFNNRDDCVYEYYYPSTVEFIRLKVNEYIKLQQRFKEEDVQYQIYAGAKGMKLCFRIYDDMMREKGICIVEISPDAIGSVLEEVASFRAGTWVVVDRQGETLGSYGEKDNVEKLKSTEGAWRGKREVDGSSVLGYADVCGFGIRIITSAGWDNIYVSLKPTIQIFGIGLIFVLAAAIAIAFSMSYRFTRSMAGLSETIRAFGHQDFDVRAEEIQIQEFHDIGVVFNDMADRIQYLITQVYEKQMLAAQSQVKYLQAQISPHFQFNVLSMLGIEAKLAGDEKVYQGLQAFSRLIQGKIFRVGEIKIRVEEELELVRFYLYLQHSRFQDRLFYEICLEQEEINRNLIPRLLIEPLVENAVSHGLEPKGDRGTVRVSLWEREESDRGKWLHVRVEDDGVGLDVGALAMGETDGPKAGNREGHTHTGLANTRRLLEILYEDRFTMEIRGRKGKGTWIEIVLPSERSDENVESNGG